MTFFSSILLATAAITDAMMFFQTPTNMPTITASAPSDSVRMGAILPELYGTASGFFERLFAGRKVWSGYPTNIYDFKTNTIQDLMPQYTPGAGLPELGPVLATNRIYSTRTYLWPWLNQIYPTSLTYGPISDSRGNLLSECNASSKLPGEDFPRIDWTEDFARDFLDELGESWINVWLSLNDLPTDGVWRRQNDSYYGEGGRIAEAIRFAYGAYWPGLEVPFNVEQFVIWPLFDRYEIVSNTCFQLLVDTIGDEATARALTNNTQRINRQQLTAIEHAIALQDTSFGYFPTPSVEIYCNDYAADYSATWSGTADWTLDFASGTMKIFGIGDATGSGSNSVTVVTNSISTPFYSQPCASCSGPSGRTLCNIQGGQAPVLAEYFYVSNAVAYGSTDMIVTQDVTDIRFQLPGTLIHVLSNGQTFDANITLSGSNTFFATSVARMTARVYYPTLRYEFPPGGDPENEFGIDIFWWENDFIGSVDCAEIIRCIWKTGFYLDDPEDVLMHGPDVEIMDGPGTPTCSAASRVSNRLARRADILAFSRESARDALDRCLELVNEVVGGDIRDINSFMSVGDAKDLADTALGNLKSSASRGVHVEDPTIGTIGISKIILDKSTGQIATVFDNGIMMTSTGGPVNLGSVPIGVDSKETQTVTPAAAFAEFFPMMRVRWRFRNLRLTD